ncbi:MAG: class I SAM-dependent methyltransferase [Ignavibacteria bacterium]|nr:class I SAM-dependent methyltransferase [Ignavibacteria bacterium]
MKFNSFNIYTKEYEDWFKENEIVFQSELLALKQLIPAEKKGVEIGIGSGIFAEKLGIKYGIDPSENMLDFARKRNLIVEKGYAENLPYPNSSFDFAVFITSICFIENPGKSLKEAFRVIKDKGELIVAIIDRDSTLGKSLETIKEDSKFYKYARFYSVPEMISIIEFNNFEIAEIVQTLINMNPHIPENPLKGYGKGGFVVIKAIKK